MYKTLLVFWRFAHAFLFYPVLIGVFIWLYVKSAHWIYGLVIVLAILVFDPIWKVLAKSVLQKLSHKNRK